MQILTSSVVAGLVIATAVGSTSCTTKQAEAQSTPDPLGPVRCYATADAIGLPSTTARQLCGGAASDAPPRCVAAARAANQLSDSQALALCYGATSTEPADCAAGLAADGKLPNQTIIQACAGKGRSVAASTDVPGCMAQGRTDLRLSDYELAELCAPGSTMQGTF